jgi:hypothetical protein
MRVVLNAPTATPNCTGLRGSQLPLPIPSTSGRFQDEAHLSSAAPNSGRLLHMNHSLPRRRVAVASKADGTADIVEVEELMGIRATEIAEDKPPLVEYLVKWKDGSPDTW